jgi:aspartate-semialdehyde dehydrogenase
VALLPLVDTFMVEEVFITTFQTLSGRGDALYPAGKVVANVYPIGATEERTEEYIAQEVSR